MLKILVLFFLIVFSAQSTSAQKNCYKIKEGSVCDVCAEICYLNSEVCHICGVAIEECAQTLCPQACRYAGGKWNNTWKAVACGNSFPPSQVTCSCILYEDTKQKIRKK